MIEDAEFGYVTYVSPQVWEEESDIVVDTVERAFRKVSPPNVRNVRVEAKQETALLDTGEPYQRVAVVVRGSVPIRLN